MVRDDADREKRLDWLRRTVETYGWRLGRGGSPHAVSVRRKRTQGKVAHQHPLCREQVMRILLIAVLAINSASAGALFAEDPAKDDLADEAIGTLVKSLNDQNERVRDAAKSALESLKATAVL